MNNISETLTRFNQWLEQAEKKKEELRLYLSSKWQAQIGQMADHPRVKTLGEEIGILRIMIKERLDLCKDASDLIMSSSSISQLIEKVERLVKTWHNIEKDRGILLDPERALALANKLVQKIAMYIEDKAILEALSEDVIQVFEQLNNWSMFINAQA